MKGLGIALLPQLARFHFRSWRVFTSAVGVFDVVMKSVGSVLCKKQSSFFSLIVLPFAFFSVFLHIHICGKVNLPH